MRSRPVHIDSSRLSSMSRGDRSTRGMTLVELLVVLAIVAGLMGGGLYYLGVMTNSSLRNESMRLTSAIKYTWTQAAMNNAQYRMVFDLEEDRYWTEVTQSPVAPDEDDTDDEESETSEQQFISEEARELERKEGRASKFDSEEDDAPFNTNREVTYKQVKDAALQPRTLPEGIEFHSVLKGGQDTPKTEGRAAIRFFPNGFQEPAIIKLEHEGGAIFSLVTEPLTGRVHIFNRNLEKQEGFGEPVKSED